MKLRVLIFINAISFSCAQARETMILGQIRDKLSGTFVSMWGLAGLAGTKDTITCRALGSNEEKLGFAQSIDPPMFGVSVTKPGKYVICFKFKGYEFCYDTVTVGKSYKAKIEIPDVMLVHKQRVRTLAEAKVRASHIKFYHKGDTLVYNADAFNVADGSMLDALIKQLPGVELKQDGQIFVNGKRVESLLMNGEYFFRGKNQLMLENLPAYTVKDVKVYERAGELTRMSGREHGDLEYVMDVRLKKEYAVGWIANAEAGSGTKDRYLASIFALRFSNHSRLALFGNMNNLNDNRKPGEQDYWTPTAMPTGFLATKRGGADYLVKQRYEDYRLEGSVDVIHTDADNYSHSSSETYLPTDNWYGRSVARSRTRNFNVNSNNRWRYEVKEGKLRKLVLYATPSMTYNKFDRSSTNAFATFDKNLNSLYGTDILDTIMKRDDRSDLLRKWAINRSIDRQKADGQSWDVSLPVNVWNIPLAGETFSLYPTFSIRSNRSNTFAETLIDHPNRPEMAADYRNKYLRNRPDRTVEYGIGVGYSRDFSPGASGGLDYRYAQKFVRHDYEYNLLSRLEGWNNSEDRPPLGELPSETDFRLKTLDGQNSYNQRETVIDHVITASFYNMGSKKSPYMRISLPVTFRHRRLNYYRGNHNDVTVYDGVTRKDFVLFSPNIHIHKNLGKKYMFYPELDYSVTPYTPDMTSFLPIENNGDPLNIYTGNPNLKMSATHNVSMKIAFSKRKSNWMLNLNPSYQIEQNAMAYGYSYNPETGVRRYKPENVNGNYRLGLAANFTKPLDKKQNLTLTSSASGTFRHGVDLIGIGENTEATRSSVGTWNGYGSLRLNYKMGKHTFGAKGNMSVNRSDSEREGFVASTLWDYNYGVTALIQLPLKLQLSSDLTIYSRRGYGDYGLNTNDLVWNARLSYKLLKPNLTFAVDGFDLLGNLHNTALTMNSQGKIETYRNALPRYVMFHVICRFAKQPKKK